MRGVPQFNFPAFHDAAQALVSAGHTVFNPAAHDEANGFIADDLDGTEDLGRMGFSLRNALGDDLSWITAFAEGVAVLPGWMRSKGARAEAATAEALGLPVASVEYFVGIGESVEPFGSVEPFVKAIHESALALAAVTEVPVALIDVEGESPLPIPIPKLEWLDEKTYVSSVPSYEVRVTSETGGAKGSKPARFDLMPTGPLWELAEHYGKGAQKYERVNGIDNWRNGYEWSLSYAAMQRHANAFWHGEDVDAETGSKHVIAVAWHAFALAHFMGDETLRGLFDDRQDGV